MATDESLLRAIAIVVAAIVLLPVVVMAIALPTMGMWGGGHMWDGGTWNGMGPTWVWLLTSIGPLLVILAVGYLLYRAVRRPTAQRRDPALEELRTAYARGDLTDEEFEQRRVRLQDDG